MQSPRTQPPRTRLRFAPSPTGHLHLGHAYSAFINQQMAVELGGDLLLRVEDIDRTRCTDQLTQDMLDDLNWLGLQWSEPPIFQKERFDEYRTAFDDLKNAGLLYPSVLSRAEIKRAVNEQEGWPTDPDGAPHYPGDERNWSDDPRQKAIASGKQHSWRLDMGKALATLERPLFWFDVDDMRQEADPARWGDVVIARSDTPTSYHLSVVVDDAAQGITHVVRGKDMEAATDIHVLLQRLLQLPSPQYFHHDLVLDSDGRKLSKSNKSISLRALRTAGKTVADIRIMIGL